MNKRKPRTDTYVWIIDAEDKYEPPSEPGLMLSAVGERLFISIEQLETHDAKTKTFTNLAEVQVDLYTFMKALMTVVDAQEFDTFINLISQKDNSDE
jgi:hypothetical protein